MNLFGSGIDQMRNDEMVEARRAARLRALQPAGVPWGNNPSDADFKRAGLAAEDTADQRKAFASSDKDFWNANSASKNADADLAIAALREGGAGQRQASQQGFLGKEGDSNREAASALEVLKGNTTLANTAQQGQNARTVADVTGGYNVKINDANNATRLDERGLINTNALDVEGVRGKNTLANTAAQGANTLAVTGAQGRNAVANTAEQNKGRLSEAELRLLQEKFGALGQIGAGAVRDGGTDLDAAARFLQIPGATDGAGTAGDGPPDAVLADGQPHTFQNGQTWQMVNGVKKRIK